jgi:hypothetical protein
MNAIKQLIFGDGGEARRQAESARNQAAVAATRQQGLAQEEQSRADTQLGKSLAVPRGRRLLLDGPAGGSPLAETVG